MNMASQIGASPGAASIDFGDSRGRIMITATVTNKHGDGDKNPIFTNFDKVTVGDVYKNQGGKGVKIESSPDFQFAIAVTREDESATQQALARANMEPRTVFRDGPLALFGFNIAENSTGEERYEIEDIKKVLDLEGIAYTVMSGANFKDEPMTLDLDPKNMDNRMEENKNSLYKDFIEKPVQSRKSAIEKEIKRLPESSSLNTAVTEAGDKISDALLDLTKLLRSAK